MTDIDALDVIVDDYIERHRPRAKRELEYFSRVLRSDEDAVERASLAMLPNGKRHPHQRRIPRTSLEKSRRQLLGHIERLRQVTTFEELHDAIDDLIRPIHKVGELTVYDTALRIGARFGLEPEKAYIHAGTRAGARALGFDNNRGTIELEELPYLSRASTRGKRRTSSASTRASSGEHGASRSTAVAQP